MVLVKFIANKTEDVSLSLSKTSF